MDMPKVLDGCDAVDVIVVGANMEVVGQQSYILVGHILLQQCTLGHGTDHIGFFSAQRFNNHPDAVPSCDFTR